MTGTSGLCQIKGSPSDQQIKEIISGEFFFPRPVLEVVHIPPQSTEEKKHLDLLLETSLLKEDQQTLYAVPSGRGEVVQILRSYPSYQIWAIQLRPCSLDLKIDRISKIKEALLVEGTVMPELSMSPLTPSIPRASWPYQNCQRKTKKWSLTKFGNQKKFSLKELE